MLLCYVNPLLLVLRHPLVVTRRGILLFLKQEMWLIHLREYGKKTIEDTSHWGELGPMETRAAGGYPGGVDSTSSLPISSRPRRDELKTIAQRAK